MADRPTPDRKFPRVALGAGIAVHDPEHGTLLGELVDLTPDGALMYSPRPFQQGAKRRFELRVPGLPPAGRAPCFEATCRWAQLKITPEACVNASGWEFAGELPLAVRAALVQAVSAQLRAAHAERRAPGRDAG